MLARGGRRSYQKQANKKSIIGLSLTIFVTAEEESGTRDRKEREVFEKNVKSSRVADIAPE